MSLEQHIQALTGAVIALTQQLQAQSGAAAATVPQAQAQQAPPQNFGAPPQQAAQGGMPGAPFGAPGGAPAFGAPPQQQMQVPFSDMNGLVAYSTDAWHALEKKGAGRGAAITQTLNGMGYAQANDIPVTAYPQFFAAIEQLKAQP